MVKRKRKSPRRHSVKSHVRAGYRVSNYVRGKGTRTLPTLTRRRKLIKTGEPKPFTVNFKYSNKAGDGESVIVISTSYDKALKEAFEERVDARQPIQVEVIDPDLGRMLRIVAERAKTAVKVGAREAGKLTKLGIKYGYAGAKVLGKEAAFAIARAYRSQKLRRLIEESYSPDRATRAMARARLKTQYPEIYSVCDFSKERTTPSTPARKQQWVRRTKAYY